jgi:type IV pilus assembly protein PilE
MKNTGFTLIEVLAALAIVGIVAGLALPSYQAHILRMRRIEARAALLNAMQEQEQYFAQVQRYAAFVPGDADFRWWSGQAREGAHYTLRAAACDGAALQTCVRVTATPDPRSHADPECASLSLSSDGAQEPARCWQ